MKKFILGTVGTFALIFGSIVFVSPANAAGAPFFTEPVVYTVGQSMSLNLGCDEADVTSVYYSDGTLPDGLSMDTLGLVTGVPTTVGTFTISGWNCVYNGGSNSGYVPSSTVTFQIIPAVTPIPDAQAVNLNMSDCIFYGVVNFPVVPDDGSVFIEIENQSGTILRSNTPAGFGLGSGTMLPQYLSIQDLNNSVNYFRIADFTSKTGTEPFRCGDTLTLKVGYQYQGAPVATFETNPFVVSAPGPAEPTTGSEPTLRVIPLNNAECEFRVIGSLPSTPLAGSTKLKIYSGDQGVEVNNATLTLSDFAANSLFDLTFKADAIEDSAVAQSGIASAQFDFTSNGDFCGTYMFVSLEYTDLLANNWTTALNGVGVVYPTRPQATQNSEYSISATQVEGACNIRVVAKAPDEARPIAIVIRNLESVDPVADWISGVIVDEPVSDGGFITANLSFASRDDINASVPVTDENIIFTEPRECTGSYLAVIDSPGGTLASTLITLGELMPTCNAGSILDADDKKCLPADRGYYTTELNSTSAIACPKGMTTATTASKSVNDCYKPIVQAIAGLKAPKAMKFKATTNLAITTNTNAIAKYKVTGSCTAKVANVTTKVKGKKVTTKMLKITSGKKSGTCSVTLTSLAKDKYLAMSKTLKIKVSKTGK
jgi:hypothetical protein